MFGGIDPDLHIVPKTGGPCWGGAQKPAEITDAALVEEPISTEARAREERALAAMEEAKAAQLEAQQKVEEAQRKADAARAKAEAIALAETEAKRRDQLQRQDALARAARAYPTIRAGPEAAFPGEGGWADDPEGLPDLPTSLAAPPGGGSGRGAPTRSDGSDNWRAAVPATSASPPRASPPRASLGAMMDRIRRELSVCPAEHTLGC